MASELTDKEHTLICELHDKTGLSLEECKELICTLRDKTGLSPEECKDAALSSGGDFKKLLKVIEQKKGQTKPASNVSLSQTGLFILVRILSRTLSFGLGLSIVILVLGVGFKGASLSNVLYTVPFCFGFAFVCAVLSAFSKDF